MSWIQKLHETYNNCQSMVGVEPEKNRVPLLPVCHTTQMAQIEIVIDGSGNFERARVIPKAEARTIIPCTESSGGRTNKEAPHPLCDKLQYVAKDYGSYGGSKKPYFGSYSSILKRWCDSGFSHPLAEAVLEYIDKGNIIRDLVSHQILIVGADGKLLSSWDKKSDPNVPEIFQVTNSQDEAFVRWVVEIPGNPESKVWKDRSLWDQWINYYKSTRKEKSFCYVAGESAFTAEMHPAKIRNDGDKAKLISSNDTQGFTFMGRFLNANQAAAVGFETSQKAHYALRWLISRQGYERYGLAIVAWATSGASVPQPVEDTYSFLNIADLPSDEIPQVSTAEEVAIKVKNRIAGYGRDIGNTADVVIMGLDSATPGRMSIIFYRNLTGSDFLQRIDDWHNSCAWLHKYRQIEKTSADGRKKQTVSVPFVGAPAPYDIAEAAYGKNVDDKLRKSTIERILPCIIDGQSIPRDLVESTVRRACNRAGIGNWEWNKTLSIACALFRKYNRKENYHMALDPDRKTRDYLYGRLLALAENIESWALSEARENRETNAARLMQRFSERPYTTWRTIEISLAPYKARLGAKKIHSRQRMIDEVVASFSPEDFLSDKRLSGEFLLGYHCQREALRSNPSQAEEPTNDSEE